MAIVGRMKIHKTMTQAWESRQKFRTPLQQSLAVWRSCASMRSWERLIQTSNRSPQKESMIVLQIAAPNSNNKFTTNIAAKSLNQNILLPLSSFATTYSTTKIIITLATKATNPVTTQYANGPQVSIEDCFIWKMVVVDKGDSARYYNDLILTIEREPAQPRWTAPQQNVRMFIMRRSSLRVEGSQHFMLKYAMGV